LDMFDVTDGLVASLLDSLSGTHLLFGSLSVNTEPVGAVVSVNGKDVGPSPVALRGLPVGVVKITARSDGREVSESQVTIADAETAEATLALARSTGKLAVEIPDDAQLKVRSAEIGEKVISGAGGAQLPTGEYEVSASCPGLESVPGQVTIRRNETQVWTPWPRAYLTVDSGPEGAAVLIDGVQRGSTPATIEVEPGRKHQVTLKLAKYHDWSAEQDFPAARKQSVKPDLTSLPGSIEVKTSLPGARIQIDGGATAKSPTLFEGIPAGVHTVTVADILQDNRFYTSGGPLTVDVKADERSVVSIPLKPGKATMTVSGAPVGSTLTVDGQGVDLQKASAGGVEIPAGALDIVITSPSQQKWKAEWMLPSGTTRKLDPKDMVPYLPNRTITVDGKIDDWAGLVPLFPSNSSSFTFPNQPGTQISKVFACRDEKMLYFRFDFSNGTPTGTLSKDIDAQLKYVVQVGVEDNNMIFAEVGFDRRSGTWTNLGVWNGATRSWKNLPMPMFQSMKYHIGDGTLEMQVPFAPLAKYVKDGTPYLMNTVIASADAHGNWGTTATSGSLRIYFTP
jgi:hypothetical protein